jgi:hypothetical protein
MPVSARAGSRGYRHSLLGPLGKGAASPCRNGSVKGENFVIQKLRRCGSGKQRGTHKDEGAVDNGCALGNRPSTGSKCGRWAAGCFYNAVGTWWFLPAGRRKQKESCCPQDGGLPSACDSRKVTGRVSGYGE